MLASFHVGAGRRGAEGLRGEDDRERLQGCPPVADRASGARSLSPAAAGVAPPRVAGVALSWSAAGPPHGQQTCRQYRLCGRRPLLRRPPRHARLRRVGAARRQWYRAWPQGRACVRARGPPARVGGTAGRRRAPALHTGAAAGRRHTPALPAGAAPFTAVFHSWPGVQAGAGGRVGSGGGAASTPQPALPAELAVTTTWRMPSPPRPLTRPLSPPAWRLTVPPAHPPLYSPG